MRIKFNKGDQRKFFKQILENTNCPSLKELVNRGISVNYSTLRNYYNEERLIPEQLFRELLIFSDLDEKKLNFEIVEEYLGQIKGGKKSKR